jgi:probable poly-beta-1,6-N-acetyl-D-glucosamine export protein
MFRRLPVLCGLAILGIMVEHAVSYGFTALFSWSSSYQALLPPGYDPYASPQYVIFVVLRQFFFFGVPVFFFTSGFFVSFAIDKKIGAIRWSSVKARILGLIVPYLLWTIVSILADAMRGHILSVPGYLSRLLIGSDGFWFVPVLIVFYLLSPFISVWAQKNIRALLLILGFLQIAFIGVRYFWLAGTTNPVGMLITTDVNNIFILNWIFFFPFGLVVGLNQSKFKLFFDHNRYFIGAIFGASFLLALLLAFQFNIYLRGYDDWLTGIVTLLTLVYSCSLILIFICRDSLPKPVMGWLKALGTRTYGIYLTHYFFMFYFSKVIYHFFPSLLALQLLFALAVLVVSLGGTLSLMWLVSKSPLKNQYELVFG